MDWSGTPTGEPLPGPPVGGDGRRRQRAPATAENRDVDSVGWYQVETDRFDEFQPLPLFAIEDPGVVVHPVQQQVDPSPLQISRPQISRRSRPAHPQLRLAWQQIEYRFDERTKLIPNTLAHRCIGRFGLQHGQREERVVSVGNARDGQVG